jgi:hypothetical protein
MGAKVKVKGEGGSTRPFFSYAAIMQQLPFNYALSLDPSIGTLLLKRFERCIVLLV